jgi:hypothetical protein
MLGHLAVDLHDQDARGHHSPWRSTEMSASRATGRIMNANFPRRIVHPGPPGHLLKRVSQPRARVEEVAGRDLPYLALVRQLPCLKCGMEPSEAAHVRFASAAFGKASGLGRKPDDRHSVPFVPAVTVSIATPSTPAANASSGIRSASIR